MNTALLVIDVQRGLFDEDPRPFEADLVVARINALLDRARLSGVPVVIIQHERAAGMLEHGSPSWQLEGTLRTQPGDHFFRKTSPDSFLRTDLHERLASLGVTHVLICGYASEFCVDTTTRRAAALGYSVTLASDAHTTHDKAHACGADIRAHENATLPNMGSFGPTIEAVPSARIEFAM